MIGSAASAAHCGGRWWGAAVAQAAQGGTGYATCYPRPTTLLGCLLRHGQGSLTQPTAAYQQPLRLNGQKARPECSGIP